MNAPFVTLASSVALALVVACGGGDGPAVPAGPNDEVPNGSDPPPNDSQPPPGTSAPPGGGAPGTPSCNRLCSRVAALACEVEEGFAANCVSECVSEILDQPCGAEIAALLGCALDAGFCPEDVEDGLPPGAGLEAACAGAAQAFQACDDAQNPDPQPGNGQGS